MQSNNPGRHRKPRPTAAMAARTAIFAGTAVTAVLVSTGAAAAATAPTTSPGASPSNIIPCTGTPFDNITHSVTLDYCGNGPGGAYAG